MGVNCNGQGRALYTIYKGKSRILIGAAVAIAVAVAILLVALTVMRASRAFQREYVVVNSTLTIEPLASYVVNFTVPANESSASISIVLNSSQPVFLYLVNSSDLSSLMRSGGAPSLLYEPGVTSLRVAKPLPGPGGYSIVIMNRASLSTASVTIYAYVEAKPS